MFVSPATRFAAHDENTRWRLSALNAIPDAALASSPPAVIAAAASVVDDEQTRAQLRDGDATVVWLRVPPHLLAQRAATSRYRPSLGTDPGDATVRMDEVRRGAYAEVADLPIDVGTRTPAEVAEEIAALIDQPAGGP